MHWGAGAGQRGRAGDALEGDRGRRAVSGVPAKAVTGGWKRRFVGQALAVTKRLKGSRGQLTASGMRLTGNLKEGAPPPPPGVGLILHCAMQRSVILRGLRAKRPQGAPR